MLRGAGKKQSRKCHFCKSFEVIFFFSSTRKEPGIWMRGFIKLSEKYKTLRLSSSFRSRQFGKDNWLERIENWAPKNEKGKLQSNILIWVVFLYSQTSGCRKAARVSRDCITDCLVLTTCFETQKNLWLVKYFDLVNGNVSIINVWPWTSSKKF